MPEKIKLYAEQTNQPIPETDGVRGTYTLEELQQMLRNETHKLMKMTSNIEEYTAGNIYYFDPMAGNPNLIQSIHLLAIHEQHHFKLVKKYQNQVIDRPEL